MISSFAIELVKGVHKKVQTITYKNGRKVKRIYANSEDRVPSEIQILAEGRVVDTLGYHDRFHGRKGQ